MRHALVAIALAGLACGKQTFLAAAFVQTPAVPNPVNPGQPFPQYQVMTAYFGSIDTTDPTKIDPSKLAPINDAAASISFHHKSTGPGDVEEDRYICANGNAAAGATPAKSPGCTNQSPAWSVSSSSTGAAYIISSVNEPRLTFENNTPYTLALITSGDGEAFGARLTPGPAGDIAEFAAATAQCKVNNPIPGQPQIVTNRCIQKTAGFAKITITRTDAPVNGALLPAFVLVAHIDPNNPGAEPQITFKTIPSDAPSLLKYVLSDIPYRWASFDIPETAAFPQTGYYVVSLLTANTGKVSNNAFLGSTALAAAGTAGIVIVQ
jgi:hypothetical protein